MLDFQSYSPGPGFPFGPLTRACLSPPDEKQTRIAESAVDKTCLPIVGWSLYAPGPGVFDLLTIGENPGEATWAARSRDPLPRLAAIEDFMFDRVCRPIEPSSL